MKTDATSDLLARADRLAPTPEIVAGLAGRVRVRARRRHIRRTAALATVGLILCAMGFTSYLHRRAGADRAQTAADVTETRQELARLEADAEALEREVNRLAKLPRTRSPLVMVEQEIEPEAPDRLAEARNRTALILLRQAERIPAADAAEATALWTRAARLFPETAAGRLAEQRLNSRTRPT